MGKPGQGRWICFGAALLVGLTGTGLLFKDLLLSVPDEVLWADSFDARLVYWIVNWGYHGLFDWGVSPGFWNANSFYPHDQTLAYSESLLGIQPFFAPFRFLGVPPLASLYLALAAVCVVSTILTVRALIRIGGLSLPEAALVAFCAHFGLSMTTLFVHYQLFGFQLAVPFFLYVYVYVRDLRRSDLLIACLLLVEGVCFSMYLAPMLAVLVVPAAMPAFAKQVRALGVRQLARRVGLRGVAVVALAGAVLYLAQLGPYFSAGTVATKQPFEQTAVYSADIGSILTSPSAFSLWYSRGGYVYGGWEYAYFPGFGLLTLSALWFLVALLRRARRPKGDVEAQSESDEPVRGESAPAPNERPLASDFLAFVGILLVACLIMSWGPYYKPNCGIRLPFYYVSKVLWGIDSIRAPGRFGMFIGLPLAVFAVAGLRSIRLGRGRVWVTWAVFLLLVVESLQAFPTYPFSLDEDGVYARVADAIEPGTPLIELPVAGSDHFDTLLITMHQLDASTIHWGRLVVGYAAKTTDEYRELLALDQSIQSGAAAPGQAIDFGTRLGIAHYLVHVDEYQPDLQEAWRSVASQPGAVVLLEEDGTLFFRFDDSE